VSLLESVFLLAQVLARVRLPKFGSPRFCEIGTHGGSCFLINGYVCCVIVHVGLPPAMSTNTRKAHGFLLLKIEAITRRILWMKSTDPKAKVLVFSSWNDVLDVLEHAFAANEISFVRMKGGRLVDLSLL